jgi:hypothetical protein
MEICATDSPLATPKIVPVNCLMLGELVSVTETVIQPLVVL